MARKTSGSQKRTMTICSLCGDAHPTRVALSTHMLTHIQGRTCHVCQGTTFAVDWDLLVHPNPHIPLSFYCGEGPRNIHCGHYLKDGGA
jgi:hypothetical protein